VFNGVAIFFSFSFLFPFLLLVIDFDGFLSKVSKGDTLLVGFIDFVLNFRF
jgi:hypothetical protein